MAVTRYHLLLIMVLIPGNVYFVLFPKSKPLICGDEKRQVLDFPQDIVTVYTPLLIISSCETFLRMAMVLAH